MTKNDLLLERKRTVIAKNLLYDANPDLIIQESPVQTYDLLARFERNPSIEFWIGVQANGSGAKNIRDYLKRLAFTLSLNEKFVEPIVLLLVGQTREEPAEFCLLTKPGRNNKATLVLKSFEDIKFKNADVRGLSEAMDEIVRWHKEQSLVS